MGKINVNRYLIDLLHDVDKRIEEHQWKPNWAEMLNCEFPDMDFPDPSDYPDEQSYGESVLGKDDPWVDLEEAPPDFKALCEEWRIVSNEMTVQEEALYNLENLESTFKALENGETNFQPDDDWVVDILVELDSVKHALPILEVYERVEALYPMMELIAPDRRQWWEKFSEGIGKKAEEMKTKIDS